MRVRVVADKLPKGYPVTPDALAANIDALFVRRMARLVEQLRIYPAATSPNYRRTGRLRDEWRWYRSRSAGEISFIAINDATNPRTGRKYAAFVQGKWQLQRMKEIGWVNVEKLLDREDIAREVQAEINRALGVR